MHIAPHVRSEAHSKVPDQHIRNMAWMPQNWARRAQLICPAKEMRLKINLITKQGQLRRNALMIRAADTGGSTVQYLDDMGNIWQRLQKER